MKWVVFTVQCSDHGQVGMGRRSEHPELGMEGRVRLEDLSEYLLPWPFGPIRCPRPGCTNEVTMADVEVMTVDRRAVSAGDPVACTTPTPAGEVLGKPCPDCGHTNLAHPGASNPSLSVCVICEMLSLLGKV